MQIIRNLVLLALMLACALSAQQVVQLADTPAVKDQHTKYSFTSGNAQYYCFAHTPASITSLSITSVSNAASAVVTYSGHGFNPLSNPTVTFSGATGSWSTLNSSFVATVIDANTFSIPLNTSSFGALAGTVVLKTAAPLLTQPIWLVLKNINDTATSTTATMWANDGYNNACTNRASLSYQ
jgi:hypothetical protein